MRQPDILLVSNGHGEAAIAGYIARAIASKNPSAIVEHLPLVGSWQPDEGPPVVGPQASMPSGGLVANWNLGNLASDVGAGLLCLLYRQRRFLRNQRHRAAIVAVGDVFCLWMALAAERPATLIATAKSDYVSPHSALERRILAKAQQTFTRDEPTAQSLRRHGLRAIYAGNLMMDGIAPSGLDLGVDTQAARFAILPGSRADAPRVSAAIFLRLLAIAKVLRGRHQHVQAFVSIAPGVSASDIVKALGLHGAKLPEPASHDGAIARGEQASLELVLVRGAFGDVLAAAQLALGQAGTANEQAAGVGLPVVAALEPGESPRKMQWYRMRQKRLLGDALLVAPPEPEEFAKQVVALLDDRQRQAAMSKAGRLRMGNPGGSAAVAAAILAQTQGAA